MSGDIKQNITSLSDGANTNANKARSLIEKLPITKGNKLVGLITYKDIQKNKAMPDACKDELGRLRVGAAIGISEQSDAVCIVISEEKGKISYSLKSNCTNDELLNAKKGTKAARGAEFFCILSTYAESKQFVKEYSQFGRQKDKTGRFLPGGEESLKKYKKEIR